jgi:hypothetical protein
VWATLLEGQYVARPDLDAFADNLNRRCTAFISRWVMPGAMAVDARLHGGLLGGVNPDTGSKYMVHMNPPWGMWPEVVQMIRKFRINCVMIYPVFRGAGFAEIEQLPIRRGPIDLPRRKHLFKAGARVPTTDLGKARFHSRAALVVWD